MRIIMGTILSTSLLATSAWGASRAELAEKASRDALAHYKSTGWLVGGCIGGFFSVLGGSIAMGMAANTNPYPPPDALSGVADEDTRYYSACYRSAIQNMEMRDVTIGVVAGMAIYTGMVAIIALTEGGSQ